MMWSFITDTILSARDAKFSASIGLLQTVAGRLITSESLRNQAELDAVVVETESPHLKTFVLTVLPPLTAFGLTALLYFSVIIWVVLVRKSDDESSSREEEQQQEAVLAETVGSCSNIKKEESSAPPLHAEIEDSNIRRSARIRTRRQKQKNW